MSAVFATMNRVLDAADTALGNLTTYQGTSKDTPTFPYVLLTYTLPSIQERALSRTPHTIHHRFRTTIVGTSTNGVEVIWGRVAGALEGARLRVAGWDLAPLESVPNAQPIQPDYDVTTKDGLHPMYAVVDWLVTGSRRPTT